MGGVVRFKFKSELGYDSLLFDGMFISVGDLKRMVGERRGMPGTELSVRRPEAGGGAYADDGELLPRNAQVVVSRVPTKPLTKRDVAEAQNRKRMAAEQQSRAGNELAATMGSLASAAATTAGGAPTDEAAALSQFVDASYSNWSSEVAAAHGGSRGGGRFGGAGGRGSRAMRSELPPPNYVCHRCGVGGHWIYNCPTNGDPEFDVKKVRAPSGIPVEKLVTSDEGTLVMPDGTVGDVMADEGLLHKEVNGAALTWGLTGGKAGMASDAIGGKGPPVAVPDEFKCPICAELITDAVLISCCQTSFCDSCIRTYLIREERCYQCGDTEVLCDDLTPNVKLRKEITFFVRSGVKGASPEAPKQLPSSVEKSNPSPENLPPNPTPQHLVPYQ